MSKLTGVTRYRLNWRKKVILQVGVWVREFTPGTAPWRTGWIVQWRDATFEDVIALAQGAVHPEKPDPLPMPPMPPTRPARTEG